MRLTPNNHSALAATFLGATVPADTDGVAALHTALDTLFNHPNEAVKKPDFHARHFGCTRFADQFS